VVVDTSALLAVIFQESLGPWAADQLQASRGYLLMSSGNYAEVLTLLQAKQPTHADLIREAIERTSIRYDLCRPHHGTRKSRPQRG
jgi:uncharacterized protein with PIN domain